MRNQDAALEAPQSWDQRPEMTLIPMLCQIATLNASDAVKIVAMLCVLALHMVHRQNPLS